MATDRWQRWRDASADLPPRAAELAAGHAVAGAIIAVTNAIAIVAAVSMPHAGAWLRVQHHFHDARLVMGVAAWLGLPFAVAAIFATRWPKRLWWVSWGAYTVWVGWAMYAMLGMRLRRQASAFQDGLLDPWLLPVYVALCAMIIPTVLWLGGYFARLGRWVALWLVAAAVAIVVGHVILRDDYPSVHAAILWGAGVGAGAGLGRALLGWLAKRRHRSIVLAATMAVCGLAAVLVPPPNAVKLQLFREPGAVAAWVLAKAVWPGTRIAATAQPPAIEELPADVKQAALAHIAKQPVVVMLTVDALRADVIADRANDTRFKTLSRLRDTGAYFSNASSAGSQTSVALTSMFASRYFSQMRWQRYGKGRSRFLYAESDETKRFPAILTDAGVETTSFLALIFMQDEFGIARGFKNQHLVTTGRRHARAAAVIEPILDELRQIKGGRHFIYAHLMEPHEPYDRGQLKKGNAWQRYLSEIELVDRWVKRVMIMLMRRFGSRGYLIISADHGEAFGEHGTRFHTKTLYDELIQVPLIIWGPGLGRRTIDARVGLVDIGPTLLHMFGLETPPEASGRSLLPLATGQLDRLPRPVFAEGRLRRAMYTEDGLKIIEDDVRKIVEAYDVKADPKELNNLFDSERERVEPAVAKMRAFFEARTLRRDGYKPPYKP